MKELYCIRNKLVKFYYRYSVDSEILSEDELNERIIKEHYNHAVELYKSIGDILFESHYFVLLSLEDRNETINAFDSIIEMDTYLERDSRNYSLALEDVVKMIEDLINLFSKLDEFITKIDKSF